MHKTGPKISSLAIVISLLTLEKIVGFIKNPFSSPSGKSVPPQTRVAPSSVLKKEQLLFVVALIYLKDLRMGSL